MADEANRTGRFPASLCSVLGGAMLAGIAMTGCAPQKPAATGPAIKQSAGVALAQTGPEGTLMSFSVDYKFLEGQPDPQAQYFWVIQDRAGEELKRPVKLRRSDNLQAIVPQWRPDRGPFTSQIVEVSENGTSRTIAPPLDLR